MLISLAFFWFSRPDLQSTYTVDRRRCYRVSLGQAAALRPGSAMEIDHMKPTLIDLLEAACGCAVLFGLLALGLWVTP
jgi:c-di-GMP-binding flagellar brake protein YcgR